MIPRKWPPRRPCTSNASIAIIPMPCSEPSPSRRWSPAPCRAFRASPSPAPRRRMPSSDMKSASSAMPTTRSVLCPSITRQITQTNTRLEFEPSGPSFHPVVSPGVNPNVPSLIPPMTVATVIYCTDCHSSDATSSAKGPHGSVYRPLLADRYETADFTPENSSSYELCYRCHSRNSILGDQSFAGHSEHLENGIPCSACHDAHGINASQGSTTEQQPPDQFRRGDRPAGSRHGPAGLRGFGRLSRPMLPVLSWRKPFSEGILR